MLCKVVLLLCLGAMSLAPAHGRAYRYRQKRPSDQRLEELASYVALLRPDAQFKMEVPVGMDLDPDEYGRKRRSSEALLQDLLERQRREMRDREGEEEGVVDDSDSSAQRHWFIDAV